MAAIFAVNVSDTKTNTKKMGRYNTYLAVLSLVFFCIVWLINSGALRETAAKQAESIPDIGRP